MTRLLLLGGTSDALQLAKKLLRFKALYIIYSVAGLVRQPQLNCTIHSGGFQGNMVHYLHQQSVDFLIDATHPYAVNISQTAFKAAQTVSIPYWQYERPAWPASNADHWQGFQDWDSLYPQLYPYKKPFFAWGREVLQHLHEIPPHQHWLIRTATPSGIQHPHVSYIQAIGGFTLVDERQLHQQYGFDVLICKNSGGHTVAHKLQLARQLQLPILMQDRPIPFALKDRFDSKNALIKALQSTLNLSTCH